MVREKRGLSFKEINTIIEDSYEENLHKKKVAALRERRSRRHKGGKQK